MGNNVAGETGRRRCENGVAGETGRRCDFVFECLEEVLEERGRRRCNCECVFECLLELLEDALGNNGNNCRPRC